MKRILYFLCSISLILTLTSCFETTTKRNSRSRQQAFQTRDGQNYSYNNKNRSGKKSAPVFNLFGKKSFKNFGRNFKFNLNEIINDNFAIIIVVFAVVLIAGFVFYQNRKSARKGSYR